LGSGFSVGVVRKWVGFAFLWLFYYDVIPRTMGRNCGSKFGFILGWNMKLERPRSFILLRLNLLLNETKPTLRTHILHHDVPRISTIFILLRLNPLGQRKLPIMISLSRMLCFGQVCASPCAPNVSAALQGTYTTSLHESLEGLNSSLAYSNGELWPYTNGVFYTLG